jgi:hypothetical protein
MEKCCPIDVLASTPLAAVVAETDRQRMANHAVYDFRGGRLRRRGDVT